MKKAIRSFLQFANRPLPGTERLAVATRTQRAGYAGAVVSVCINLLATATLLYLSVVATIAVGRFYITLRGAGVSMQRWHWLVPIVPVLMTLLWAFFPS